eukprot:CAMPEP_0113692980 /NCGR_PEP_ID=MMETSP0038_2-20120614/19407_1 /TAXON_ID=2898 /ORGANISM="Cryptomonas paramecium" /LENGTH=223 /DNA_ID=CAMNT_0000614995 /DNA_START=251 /DNA_END=923 /DNA_ORIENTATION=- /assembly_acc=CAM_ASM_000170
MRSLLFPPIADLEYILKLCHQATATAAHALLLVLKFEQYSREELLRIRSFLRDLHRDEVATWRDSGESAKAGGVAGNAYNYLPGWIAGRNQWLLNATRPVIAVTHLQNCQGFEVVSNVQNLSNDTKQWVKARNRALERCLSHFASDLGVSRLDLFPLELSGRKSCLLHTRCYASKDNLHKPENLCNDIGGKLNFISADQYVDMISALKARAMEYYGRVCPRAE